MKICVLLNSYEQSDSPFKDHDATHDIMRHLTAHEAEYHLIHKKTAVKQVRELIGRRFDLFINLCDGALEEDRAGKEVVETLEKAGVPFTGADSPFYEPSRETMKMICDYYGLLSPESIMTENDKDIELAHQTLRYPMIVKHPNSYSSIGLTVKSRVTNLDELTTQCRIMMDNFGKALVEEFIEGDEYTSLVVENPADPEHPFVYDPIKYSFPEGETFKHFDLKWIHYQGLKAGKVDDREILEKIKTDSATFFYGMRGRGYGRCDIRVDRDGGVYFLEINPNCSVFNPTDEPGSADLILMSHPEGHVGFINRIIDAAVRNAVRRQKKYKVKKIKGSYGSYAVKNIGPDETIRKHEEESHTLVTRSYTENNWSPRLQKWFLQYAWPLNREVSVTWSPDPEEWMPINHSCDPNAWLTGLNLTARRSIRQGEEITVDYVTFCGADMEPFECQCGSPGCRKWITGMDKNEIIKDTYKGHYSPYIEELIDKAARSKTVL